MKEVKAGRIAGPFDQIPFKNYIQSPVGLVPKAGGKTRMIFHLSYEFSEDSSTQTQQSEQLSDNMSLNACTPKEICSVKYNDLDHAVANCLRLVQFYHGRVAEGIQIFAKRRSQLYLWEKQIYPVPSGSSPC